MLLFSSRYHTHGLLRMGLALLCMLPFAGRLSAQRVTEPGPWQPDLHHAWVDSVYNSLSLDERIAQLMMVAAYSNRDEAHQREIADIIRKHHIGSLVFFQGGPVRQARQTNYYQSISKIPLLIAIDGEWGLAMRLDSVPLFPRQMLLGAIQDDRLVYRFGREVARECRRMGIHINFAPVVDINTNPKNPVIGNRAFGDSKDLVTRKAWQYMQGLQDGRILTSAKHFPGHGDTETDSHLGLPVVNASRENLGKTELFPYKDLINRSLTGVMVSHLHVPALDPAAGSIASISRPIVTGLLRDELKFNGLIYTDAMNMAGLSNTHTSADACVAALQAGVDVLVMPDDVPGAIQKIKAALQAGQLSEAQIAAACRRVLYAKVWSGAWRQQPVSLSRLADDLNSPEADLLARDLAQAGLTLLRNQHDVLPLTRLDPRRTAVVLQGVNGPNTFLRTLSKYQETDVFYLPRSAGRKETAQLLKQLRPYDVVITSIHDTNYKPADHFGITQQEIDFTRALADSTRTILAFFGVPYALNLFGDLTSCDAVLLGYQDQVRLQDYAAQAIYGAVPVSGKLPVGLHAFRAGTGLEMPGGMRLKFSIPAEVHADEAPLRRIDSLIRDAISRKVMPGCQILAAKNGVVFFNKCYGGFTYDAGTHQVTEQDLYDLASVTKIAASVPALMQLEDEARLDITQHMSVYWPPLRNTNKRDITFVEALSHIAGLQPYVDFYLRTLTTPEGDSQLFSNRKDKQHTIPVGSNHYLHNKVTWKDGYYVRARDPQHQTQVANQIFLRNDFRDSIFTIIDTSELLPVRSYKYSDLAYYYVWRIVERITDEPMQDYLQRTLYDPLGATTMGYLPLRRFPAGRIAPTENDTYFRRQLLQGYVHDQGAAMLGGVCGHAGLFSSAIDLAKIMQLYLNKGVYGGVRYLSEDRIAFYTSAHFADLDNRRGVGFDRPLPEYSTAGPVCEGVSQQSFGHSGFTGSYTWADPENGLLFVFLTNRLYPNEMENLLARQDIRTRIHQWLVDALP